MKRVALLPVLLTLASSAIADFAGLPNDVRANLPAIQKYPKAASILLWCSESFVLNADGSQSYEWHSFRYFPDEAARDTWGDPRINYAEGRQQVEILQARTYTDDGRHIDCTPENAYNPVVPDGMDLAPDFGEYRQLVVTLLGLENGCISEFQYRVTTPKPLIPWLEGRVYFREEVPVIARELSVQIPDGIKLGYQIDRGAPEPSVSGNRYLWKVGEQPGYLAEDLAGHRVLLPNVAFTTAEDWQRICAEISHRVEIADADKLALPKSLSEALTGISTDEARLDAIKKWVRERFRKLHFDHPEFPVSLRPSKRVLNSGYGNGLEFAVLVKSLAANWGIRCDLVLRFLPEPVVPSLHEWADPVLEVQPDLGAVYLTDPLAARSETALGIAASTLYDLSTCEEREPVVRGKGTPRFNLRFSLSGLDADTVHGRGSLITIGPWGCVEKMQEQGAADYLNSLVALPGFTCTSARVQELSDRGRVAVDFEFTMAPLDTADDYRVLALSALDFTKLVKGAPWGLPRREFAQEMPLVGEIKLHVEAAIPEMWQIARRPASSSETWDWSEGEIECREEDGRLVFERRLNLAREWLAPSGWSGFRTWMIESGPRPNNCVVFEPNPEEKAAR